MQATPDAEIESPRAKLLAAAVDHVLAHGLSDLSLRELAAAIGTSHRMLIYHFGSKEGLIVAVIRTVEEAQRRAFAELETAALSPADAMRAMWRRFTDPSLGPHERLFFEIYGQALQGRPGAVDLLDGIIESWVEPTAQFAIARGADPAAARAEARLGVAVTRGLLLDWLATGDREGVDRAFEHYVGLTARDGLRFDGDRPTGSMSTPRERRPAVAASMSLRPARPEEARALSELALRSKAHWDYTDEFIEACREELTLDPDEVIAHRATIALIGDAVAGFFTLVGEPPDGEMAMFFVAPEQIGTGIGAALLARLRADARAEGFTRLRIEADPNAVGFYEHHGARRVGDAPSASIPGRSLPVLELDLT